MSEGIFPEPVTPIPFDSRVGVTTAAALLDENHCKLRIAWNINRIPRSIPRYPKTITGSIKHEIIEKSSSVDEDPESFVQQIIQEVEEKLPWFERHLIPLRDSDPSFNLELQRLIRKIRLVRGDSIDVEEVEIGTRWYGREVWLPSTSNPIVGMADSIIDTSEGTVIIDDKTGLPPDDGDREEILRKNERQLRLYSAIFNENTGIEPLLLVVHYHVNDDKIEFKPDTENDRKLLGYLGDSINKLSAEIGDSTDFSDLASPSPSNCLWCPHRPVCADYQNGLSHWEYNDRRDVIGIVERLSPRSNGTISIEIRSTDDQLIKVKGTIDHPHRNPALGIIREGSRIGVFNVFFTRDDKCVVESRNHILYVSVD